MTYILNVSDFSCVGGDVKPCSINQFILWPLSHHIHLWIVFFRCCKVLCGLLQALWTLVHNCGCCLSINTALVVNAVRHLQADQPIGAIPLRRE